jgi:multicomponent Na+:H+ antiporter subunit D
MNWILVLPVLIPMITASLCLIFQRSIPVQRWLGLVGTSASLVVSILLFHGVWTDGIQVVQMGNWPAPFGISFVADLLSAVMVVITAIMGLAVAVYSVGTIDKVRERFGYYPLYHVLLLGINGSFLTGDLFNLYVWFEVMLISSFVLLVLGNERAQVRGALHYVLINLFSSLCFLTAVGLLYGTTGALNMADLSVRLGEVGNPGLVTTLSMLFLVAFGIKAAVFPLFFWLPASYHTPPVAISAIFAGMLTKVGVYALIRVFTLLFTQDVGYTHTIILVVAGLTMITGVLGAAAQTEVRRILSFHIISQIGYMIMGLALFTPLALVGAVFYIVHHIIVKTNLFLVGGVAHRLLGSYELKSMGGLYRSHPMLAVLFLIPAFSLAGFPPLSGFWAKLILIKAGLDVGQYAIVAVALAVGVLTLFSMTKIWSQAFWEPLGHEPRPEPGPRRPIAWLLAPVIALAIMTLIIGLWTEPFYEFASRAAVQLLNPAVYVQAVLGGGGG